MDKQAVPAVERLAVKLIKNSPPLHLGLKMWADTLVSSFDASVCYIDFLTEGKVGNTSVVQMLAEKGYDVDPARPEMAWKEYLDKFADPVVYHSNQLPLGRRVVLKRIDEAVYQLCNALRLFRVTGRQPSGSGGYDEDSLVSALATFYESIVNAFVGSSLRKDEDTV